MLEQTDIIITSEEKQALDQAISMTVSEFNLEIRRLFLGKEEPQIDWMTIIGNQFKCWTSLQCLHCLSKEFTKASKYAAIKAYSDLSTRIIDGMIDCLENISSQNPDSEWNDFNRYGIRQPKSEILLTSGLIYFGKRTEEQSKKIIDCLLRLTYPKVNERRETSVSLIHSALTLLDDLEYKLSTPEETREFWKSQYELSGQNPLIAKAVFQALLNVKDQDGILPSVQSAYAWAKDKLTTEEIGDSLGNFLHHNVSSDEEYNTLVTEGYLARGTRVKYQLGRPIGREREILLSPHELCETR